MKNNINFSDLSVDIETLLLKIDDLVVSSFGGSKFNGFKSSKTGLSIFLPRGDNKYYKKTHWSYQVWYHPDNISNTTSYLGNLMWCKNNATPNNNIVENWFELLDCWFDTKDDTGGVNFYTY